MSTPTAALKQRIQELEKQVIDLDAQVTMKVRQASFDKSQIMRLEHQVRRLTRDYEDIGKKRLQSETERDATNRCYEAMVKETNKIIIERNQLQGQIEQLKAAVETERDISRHALHLKDDREELQWWKERINEWDPFMFSALVERRLRGLEEPPTVESDEPPWQT